MKYKEPKAMKEIHAIRIALYEQKKKMSIKERVQLTNRIAKELIKDYKLGVELLPTAKRSIGV